MSYIELHEFDASLVKCELVTTGPKSVGEKGKSQIKLGYGPTRKAIAFVTPPCVLDWPRLTGEGNLGTKFGPTEPDKAQFTVGLTDRPVPEVPAEAMCMLFTAINQIDHILATFVHQNQKELLGCRDLSLEAIKGKGNASVKPKYDEQGDLKIYDRMNLATRKFTWNGEERVLKLTDASGNPLAEDQPPRHEDVAAVAFQVDYCYTGVNLFGVKYAVRA